MKTFATLCLIGFASAIQLKEEGERGPKHGDDHEGPEGPNAEQCQWILSSDQTLETVRAYAIEQHGEDFADLDQEDLDGAIAFCTEQGQELAQEDAEELAGPSSSSDGPASGSDGPASGSDGPASGSDGPTSGSDDSCDPDVDSCRTSSAGPSTTDGPSSSDDDSSTTEEEDNGLAQLDSDASSSGPEFSGPIPSDLPSDLPSSLPSDWSSDEAAELAQVQSEDDEDSSTDGASSTDGTSTDGTSTDGASSTDDDEASSTDSTDGELAQVREGEGKGPMGPGPAGPGSDGSDDEGEDGPDAEDCEFAAALFADGLPTEAEVAAFVADEWDSEEPLPTEQ